MKVITAFLLLALVICAQVNADVMDDGVALDKPGASEQGLLSLSTYERRKRGVYPNWGRRKRGVYPNWGRRKRGSIAH